MGLPPDHILQNLISPLGVCQLTASARQADFVDERLYAAAASCGNPWLMSDRAATTPFDPRFEPVHGSGRAPDVATAELIAVVEAVERYAPFTYADDTFTTASAHEVAADGLDLDRLPRLSAAELARVRGRYGLPDKRLPIRWVAGTDLLTGADVLVPAVLVYYISHKTEGERFHVSISTGAACHFDKNRAILSGLLEVIERDAIALTWLQRLRLERLSEAALGADVSDLADSLRRQFLDIHLFDATFELSVPTVLCVLTAPHAESVGYVLGAATALDLAAAATHSIFEAIACMPAIQRHSPPEDPWLCHGLLDGAAYTGRPERGEAFDFLLSRLDASSVGHRPSVDRSSSERALETLLAALSAQKMHPVAVDLTPSECDAVGLHVVKVIVPELQPFSPDWAAQYRAHERLYSGPEALGYPAATEPDLNPWPIPFA